MKMFVLFTFRPEDHILFKRKTVEQQLEEIERAKIEAEEKKIKRKR